MILTMVAMLSMTMAFAEGENMNSVNNMAAYDMSCNTNKLAEALSLTADQREAVDNIYQTFTAEVKHAIGVHDLYICFSNASGETHLDWWKFNK